MIQGSRELPLEDTLMQNSTLFRRAAALLLTAALALTLVLPGLAAYEMPIQTVNEGESVYLFNADIDKPILEQNADQQRYIARLRHAHPDSL